MQSCNLPEAFNARQLVSTMCGRYGCLLMNRVVLRTLPIVLESLLAKLYYETFPYS